jgi:hypothetical protein
MANQLVDFVRAKKEKATSPELNWQAKKDSWVRSVEHLYDYVTVMLEDSLSTEEVTRTPMTVTEDFVGEYSIPMLELRIGNERVEFRPKGITVIGAEGRVDVRGEGGTVTLLKDQQEAWSVVVERVPHFRTILLDNEGLKYTLERVMLP